MGPDATTQWLFHGSGYLWFYVHVGCPRFQSWRRILGGGILLYIPKPCPDAGKGWRDDRGGLWVPSPGGVRGQVREYGSGYKAASYGRHAPWRVQCGRPRTTVAHWRGCWKRWQESQRSCAVYGYSSERHTCLGSGRRRAGLPVSEGSSSQSGVSWRFICVMLLLIVLILLILL